MVQILKIRTWGILSLCVFSKVLSHQGHTDSVHIEIWRIKDKNVWNAAKYFFSLLLFQKLFLQRTHILSTTILLALEFFQVLECYSMINRSKLLFEKEDSHHENLITCETESEIWEKNEGWEKKMIKPTWGFDNWKWQKVCLLYKHWWTLTL